MKTIYWVLGIGIAALGAWYIYSKKATPAAASPVANTNTATTPATWFPSWANATQLKSTTASVTGAFTDLKSISNIFGSNDGGKNPGVSVSGSSTGGTQSSGSGAGLPVDDSGSDNSSYDDFSDSFAWS